MWMDKEELENDKDTHSEVDNNTEIKEKSNLENKDEIKEDLSPKEEIENLKDKLTRTFAEMENQRRRFEKEKDDAFEYGGFAFAKEALNLLDNLERAKVSLENDETLKNTNTLKKVLEHLDIINKDMLSIFQKNNIAPIKSINEDLIQIFIKQ